MNWIKRNSRRRRGDERDGRRVARWATTARFQRVEELHRPAGLAKEDADLRMVLYNPYPEIERPTTNPER